MAKKMFLQMLAPIRLVCGSPREVGLSWLFGYFRRDQATIVRRGQVNVPCCLVLLVVIAVLVLISLLLATGGAVVPGGRLGYNTTYNYLYTTRHDPFAETEAALEPTAACNLPDLDPYDPEIKAFDYSVSKLQCSTEENWVYVKNGTFRKAASAVKKHGRFTCDIEPIERQGDFDTVAGSVIKDAPDGFALKEDFFKVRCNTSDEREYTNVHLGVAYRHDLHTRAQSKPLPPKAMGGYDMLILGFDSTSRLSWMRNLPQTRKFFLNGLGGIELEGHNILGDGTVAAIMPLLTGNLELDLPSARRDNASAVPYMDDFPFIWKNFKDAGYVTAWGEDTHAIGTFQVGYNTEPFGCML
ncbi:hypothetical protein ElyMa_001628500 [Elysia marginata]|uniref:Uncharacterized protein n=1 Tax=Elysia marginata TaxID=1093978 RepID=A0AAV4JNL9_9GAST|nr:hypothetical protein ElyMa_001628500 [Elysia marginata]